MSRSKPVVFLSPDAEGTKKLLDALINLCVLKLGYDENWTGGPRNFKQIPITQRTYDLEIMAGKNLRRLFNDVKFTKVKQMLTVTEILENPFCEIDDITYPKEETKAKAKAAAAPAAAAPAATGALILASQPPPIDLKYYIKSRPKNFTKTFPNGKKKTVSIYQHAIIDFGVQPMTVEFRLFTQEHKKDKFVFNSKYQITPGGIILYPYTTDEAKKIKPIVKKIYQEVKLPKQNEWKDTDGSKKVEITGTKVNIFEWINKQKIARGDLKTKMLTCQSNLVEIKKELASFNFEAFKLSRTKDEQIKYRIYQWINENVLETQEKLDAHKEDVDRWFKNYQEYHGVTAPITKPEDLNLECEYDDKNQGTPHISMYTSKLVDRTQSYDARIRKKSAIDNLELKLEDNEKNKLFNLESEKRNYDIRESQEKAKPEPNNDYLELLKKQNQASIKKINAKFKILEDDLRKLQKFEVLEGEFGIYAPYLVSDILRHHSTFVKQHTIDELCITSENIVQFCSFIHGFKSIAFTFTSLFMQLISEHAKQLADLKARSPIQQTKISFEFFMPLYKGLDLNFDQKTIERLAALTDQTSSQHPKPIFSPFGASVSQEFDESQKLDVIKPISTSTTVSNLLYQSQFKPNFSDAPNLTIKRNLVFDATQSSQEDLIKLVQKFEEGSEPQSFQLLQVNEPMFGDSGAVQDFDVLYYQSYLKLKEDQPFSMDTTSLGNNFNLFLRALGEYESDQILLDDALSDSYFPDLTISQPKSQGQLSTTTKRAIQQIASLPIPKFDDWPAKNFTIEKGEDKIEVEIDLPKSNSPGNIVLEHASDSYSPEDVIINGNKITIKPIFRKESTESNPINIKAIQEEVPLNFSQGKILTQIYIYKEGEVDSGFVPGFLVKDDSKRTFGATEIKDKQTIAKHQAWLQKEKAAKEETAKEDAAKAAAKKWETLKELGKTKEDEAIVAGEEATKKALRKALKGAQREFEKDEICKHLIKNLVPKKREKVCDFVETNLKILKKSQLNNVLQFINENENFSNQAFTLEQPQAWMSTPVVTISEILRLKELWLDKLKAEAEAEEKAKEEGKEEGIKEKEAARQRGLKREKPGRTGGSYEKYIKYKTKYLELKAKLNL
jgi:hypothetical protein